MFFFSINGRVFRILIKERYSISTTASKSFSTLPYLNDSLNYVFIDEGKSACIFFM